ncbi:tRNA dihydrouridine(20/20a) synthase DusA [Catenovulum sp. 2E275]|uniref:tRNA dihydrouridine(20/20a) synthase DusA n=1 Tax=Catenovulum sp. 2E275 TaxID=2980497 RepID=UPI0021D027F6|nr:tRNA dihydrouridine(20/20a) synthase DusA [Catenovulum sp. 2E275]MCU4675510.1 tRNA dihydrouridine(20/20a) synthase DusA [Catenovulum sp. 2E275]
MTQAVNNLKPEINHLFSVAPMLDWTDRHCRYFYRVMSKQAVLYTEMVTTGAIIYGKGDYLQFHQAEHPVVLQLGGSDPADMAKAAVTAQKYGYDEININVGCPSDRVQNGRFGACLMAEPDTVSDCLIAMQQACDLPVTVKSRIGIDDFDSYEFLTQFVEKVQNAGCQHFIVHARKAWLKGLSPKQNREIPPLDYQRVYQLKKDFPELTFSINGGIETIEQAKQHLEFVDGVMLGRAVYQNPFLMQQVDEHIYDQTANTMNRFDVAEAMLEYMEIETAQGATSWHIARHMLGLFNGQPKARLWRRFLSENARQFPQGNDLLKQAIQLMK